MPRTAKEVVIDQIEHQLNRITRHDTPEASALLQLYSGIPSLIDNSRREMQDNGRISTEINILLSIENLFRNEIDKICGREYERVSFPSYSPTSNHYRDFDDNKPHFGGDYFHFDSHLI